MCACLHKWLKWLHWWKPRLKLPYGNYLFSSLRSDLWRFCRHTKWHFFVPEAKLCNRMLLEQLIHICPGVLKKRCRISTKIKMLYYRKITNLIARFFTFPPFLTTYRNYSLRLFLHCKNKLFTFFPLANILQVCITCLNKHKGRLRNRISQKLYELLSPCWQWESL